MKATRIRQLEKLVRALQADGYAVEPRVNTMRNWLMIVISLKNGESEEIMTQWNDLKRVTGS